jgi:two-component system cell cycle sensor histidine kinase/response regulator CckA
MGFRRGIELERDAEVAALRREVTALRERVGELQRQTARHDDTESTRTRGGVEVTVSAREDLLVEAERIAHVGSWVWDVETGGVFWSDEMFRLLGYDPEWDRASTEAFFARVHPDDRERVRGAAAAGVASGVAEQVDYRMALPGGRVRFVTMNAALLFDAAGKLRRLVGTVRDLTEQRELQAKMENSVQLLEQAQRIAQMGSWSFDVASGKTEWTSGMYRVFGLDSSATPSAELFFSSLLPEDGARVRETHARGVLGDWTEELEIRFRRSDGELRHARVRTIAVRDSNGQLSEFHGTLVDTTDQIELAERCAQIGKTEAVARLAAGIAHDFNNLLTVIGANVELWGEAAGAHAEIVDTRRAVQSARALTDRLLTLGRKAPLSRQVVDPNELVTRTVELLRRVVGDNVQLLLALAPDLPAICVDPAWIEHALINLVINARDAMPSGGRVRVETRGAADAEPQVVIDVIDDGPGMGPEVRSRIFEPFFTTKGEGGTGLGLPTVLATIEQHGGSVDVESELGVGTRVRLRLPAEPTLHPKSLVPEAEQPDLGKVCREILVVEDEPLVAAVIARSLEREGHTPLLAHRPSDALQLWTEHPDVDLLICDVSMAEMRGPELVRVLRGTGRDFSVLYVTGFDEEGAADTAGERVLSKPFGPRDLLRALAEF